MNGDAVNRVSRRGQKIATRVERLVNDAAGERVAFSLFVWTEGRCTYLSNSPDRAEIKTVLKAIIDGWDDGMPDIPAHEIQ